MMKVSEEASGAAWGAEMVSDCPAPAGQNREAMQRTLAKPSQASHQGIYTYINTLHT